MIGEFHTYILQAQELSLREVGVGACCAFLCTIRLSIPFSVALRLFVIIWILGMISCSAYSPSSSSSRLRFPLIHDVFSSFHIFFLIILINIVMSSLFFCSFFSFCFLLLPFLFLDLRLILSTFHILLFFAFFLWVSWLANCNVHQWKSVHKPPGRASGFY